MFLHPIAGDATDSVEKPREIASLELDGRTA
jgi:hypothetical protein